VVPAWLDSGTGVLRPEASLKVVPGVKRAEFALPYAGSRPSAGLARPAAKRAWDGGYPPHGKPGCKKVSLGYEEPSQENPHLLAWGTPLPGNPRTQAMCERIEGALRRGHLDPHGPFDQSLGRHRPRPVRPLPPAPGALCSPLRRGPKTGPICGAVPRNKAIVPAVPAALTWPRPSMHGSRLRIAVRRVIETSAARRPARR